MNAAQIIWVTLSGMMTEASILRGTYNTSFKPFFMSCQPNFQTRFSVQLYV